MNITVRNIPDEIVQIMKTLSQLEKRSLNNEILTIIEKGVQKEIARHNAATNSITINSQIKIWRSLSKQWEDNRSTKEIINDIYSTRSFGRDIKL